eukprot:16447934-Heterocapsa_arctica.AAC.1
MRELWVQDQIRGGQVEMKCVGMNDNPADLFTKNFGGPRYRVFTGLTGLRCADGDKAVAV